MLHPVKIKASPGRRGKTQLVVSLDQSFFREVEKQVIGQNSGANSGEKHMHVFRKNRKLCMLSLLALCAIKRHFKQGEICPFLWTKTKEN